jgi:hypothetical protein
MMDRMLKNVAARRKARADDPSSIVSFHRDDSNPTMKKTWDKKVAAANKYAAGTDTKPLLFKSFQTLRLDQENYNMSLPTPLPGPRPKLYERLIKQYIFVKADMTGAPFLTGTEIEDVSKQIEWTKGREALTLIIYNEQREWMRATARLRRCNILVDFGGIRHLEWLKD